MDHILHDVVRWRHDDGRILLNSTKMILFNDISLASKLKVILAIIVFYASIWENIGIFNLPPTFAQEPLVL